MKIYTLSVNTFTWNLTSERHDNCAPCLGLILPIRWVTPPSTSLVWSVSLKALYCNDFAFGLSSVSICLHDFLHYDDLIAFWYIYKYTSVLSSTTFTYSYVFKIGSFELSECDRTLTSLCFLSQNLSVQIICILLKLSNVFSASLSAEDTETNIKTILNAQSLLPETRRRRNDHPTIKVCVGHGTNPKIPHNGHVFLRCESPRAPV